MASLVRPILSATAASSKRLISARTLAAPRAVSIAGPSRLASLPRLQWHSTAAPSPSPSASSDISADETDHSVLSIEAPVPGTKPQPIGKIEPRLSMTFTCTANDCGHRSTHEFAKRSYTKGIVLVQCPSCKNRHLIADHLGWFKESTDDGSLKTVEDLLRARGEKIKTGKVNFEGDIEYDPEQ